MQRLNAVRFISTDRYKRGLSSLRRNVSKPKHVAVPTPHKVHSLFIELGAKKKKSPKTKYIVTLKLEVATWTLPNDIDNANKTLPNDIDNMNTTLSNDIDNTNII